MYSQSLRLGWASDHFYRKTPVLPAVGFPLSWKANYAGMAVVAPAYVTERLSAPHT